MAETPSTFSLKTGNKAPGFVLPDVCSGTDVSLSQRMGPRGTLVMFVCNHCPYVILLADALGEWAGKAATRGVATLAINSNDVENYPLDSPEKMKEFARTHGWSFPYLYDESQDVARSFDAACTPDFFLLDGEGKVFYMGQFDYARPGNGREVTGESLNHALECLLEGKALEGNSIPSAGCNIKWKS